MSKSVENFSKCFISGTVSAHVALKMFIFRKKKKKRNFLIVDTNALHILKQYPKIFHMSHHTSYRLWFVILVLVLINLIIMVKLYSFSALESHRNVREEVHGEVVFSQLLGVETLP